MPYENYLNFNFEVPFSVNGDSYDRYLLRIEELFQSNLLMLQAINNLPLGPIKTVNYKIIPPSKMEIKSTIQGLIFHFQFFSNKLPLNKGEVYIGVEAPKGEFGVFFNF